MTRIVENISAGEPPSLHHVSWHWKSCSSYLCGAQRTALLNFDVSGMPLSYVLATLNYFHVSHFLSLYDPPKHSSSLSMQRHNSGFPWSLSPQIIHRHIPTNYICVLIGKLQLSLQLIFSRLFKDVLQFLHRVSRLVDKMNAVYIVYLSGLNKAGIWQCFVLKRCQTLYWNILYFSS